MVPLWFHMDFILFFFLWGYDRGYFMDICQGHDICNSKHNEGHNELHMICGCIWKLWNCHQLMAMWVWNMRFEIIKYHVRVQVTLFPLAIARSNSDLDKNRVAMDTHNICFEMFWISLICIPVPISTTKLEDLSPIQNAVGATFCMNEEAEPSSFVERPF